MDVESLQNELQVAREELAAATAALAPKHKGGEWERLRQAQDPSLTPERDLARAGGQECAIEIEWPAPWDAGAPLPHVVSSGSRTYVIYHVGEPDPNWDGSYAAMVDPSALVRRSIAIVTFERCIVYKFGAPN